MCTSNSRRIATQVSQTTRLRRDVYISRKALVGSESIARFFPRLLSWHHMVAIRSEAETWICDFLPSEPTDPVVLIRLLTFGEVPGEVRTVKVRQGLWREQEEYIGEISDPEFLQQIAEFNAKWNRSLSLCKNDCRNYVQALSAYLIED